MAIKKACVWFVILALLIAVIFCFVTGCFPTEGKKEEGLEENDDNEELVVQAGMKIPIKASLDCGVKKRALTDNSFDIGCVYYSHPSGFRYATFDLQVYRCEGARNELMGASEIEILDSTGNPYLDTRLIENFETFDRDNPATETFTFKFKNPLPTHAIYGYVTLMVSTADHLYDENFGAIYRNIATVYYKVENNTIEFSTEKFNMRQD